MSKNHEIMAFPVGDIVVDEAWNPRKEYDGKGDGESIEHLAKDFAKNGQLTPVIVRLVDVDGVKVPTLIAGFRRMRAAKIAGLATVKAVVVEVDGDSGARIVNLIENIQRKSLSPAELAIGLAELAADGMSPNLIAGRVGLSKSHCSNLIRIRKDATQDVWGRFSSGKLTTMQALAIVGAGKTEEEQQAKLAEELGLVEKKQEAAEDDAGEVAGDDKPAKEKGPSKPKPAEVALTMQSAREIAAGRLELPKTKRTAEYYKGVAAAIAWVTGETQQPPFKRPKVADDAVPE
ncbi:MAG: ParB/RepB/Spo0J family partition protein [Candidatus Competibacteraceae bacterium]|nr:ParB/RepB/Spo0J family partition protein [Candidatus Competibacteraceae bacterium]